MKTTGKRSSFLRTWQFWQKEEEFHHFGIKYQNKFLPRVEIRAKEEFEAPKRALQHASEGERTNGRRIIIIITKYLLITRMTFGGDLRFAETRHRPVPSCPRCRPWRDESAKNVPAVHDRPARGFLFGVGTPRALYRRTCARTALYDYYYRSTRCRNTTHALTAARRHDGRGERPFSFRPVRARLFTYIGVEKNIKKKLKKKKRQIFRSKEPALRSPSPSVGRLRTQREEYAAPATLTKTCRRRSFQVKFLLLHYFIVCPSSHRPAGRLHVKLRARARSTDERRHSGYNYFYTSRSSRRPRERFIF